MDNALIDDRRIHVDFSQSVAKQWSEYRRGKRNQSGKGSGCFKCGAADHIAKDCNQDSDTRERPQKYVLKDENAQRGGDVSKSYDMVFDGDDAAIPEYHENGAGDKKKTEKIDHRHSRDSRHRSHERSERHDRHEDKNRRHREDERIHRSSRDDAHDQHRERAYGEGEKAKDRISDRHGRNERDYDRHKDGDRHRRNERDYERNRESDRHRSNDGDTRNRAMSSDKHKREESDHYAKSRGDQDRNRRDDGDRRKRSGGNDAEYERDRKHR
ncbi:hypothetical protein QJS04_geneDACA014408 [Acorus gramineus]|uniref:CCHC-type domain-containing protein n=1 Tax=Acorus gramineus TaxID=55184 RepID=A0AAV9BLB6_ACOGR|nr:hypothetical protein QJS04_geneDACA014408 [Acorus gramineus]